MAVRVVTMDPGATGLRLSLVDDGAERERCWLHHWNGTRPGLLGRHPWDAADVAAVRFMLGTGDRASVVLNDQVITELAALTPFAPVHQPRSLRAARLMMNRWATVVGCFDTVLPAEDIDSSVGGAMLDRLRSHGYGSHGLSCRYAVRRTMGLTGAAVDVPHSVCVYIGETVSVAASVGGQIVDASILASVPGPRHRLLDALGAACRGSRDGIVATDVYVRLIRRRVTALASSLGRLDLVVFTGTVAVHNPRLVAAIAAGLTDFGVHTVDDLVVRGGDRLVSPPGAAPLVSIIVDRDELELAALAETALDGDIC